MNNMTKYKKLPRYNVDSIHFVTTKTYNKKPFFLDYKCCDILIENMDTYRNELLYKIFVYVIMPDHLHVLIWFDVNKMIGDELLKRGEPVSTHIHTPNGVGSDSSQRVDLGLPQIKSNQTPDRVDLGLPQIELNGVVPKQDKPDSTRRSNMNGVNLGSSQIESNTTQSRVNLGLPQTNPNVNITSKSAPLSISKIMHRIKGKTATDIRKMLNIDFKWQPKFYDFNIISEKKLIEKMDYIHKNPFKDNRIKNPDKYPYCSRLYLESGEGIFRVDRITDFM